MAQEIMETKEIIRILNGSGIIPSDTMLRRFVSTIKEMYENISGSYTRIKLDKYLKTVSRTDATIIKMFNVINKDRLDVCSFVPEKRPVNAELLLLGNRLVPQDNPVSERNGLVCHIMAFTWLPITRIIKLTDKDLIYTESACYLDGYVVPDDLINHDMYNIVYSISPQGKIIDEPIKNPKSLYNDLQPLIDKSKKDVIIWTVENPYFEWEM
jgi:hypothetical protein